MQQHGDATRPQLVAIAVCITLIVASTLVGPSALRVAPLAATLALVAVHYRRLFAWPSLITGLILIILFIPMAIHDRSESSFSVGAVRIYVLLLLGMWIVVLIDGTGFLFPRIGARSAAVRHRQVLRAVPSS